MTDPTLEALAKLPKWAREHITQLTRQLEATRTALAGYTAGHAGSPISYFDIHRDAAVCLPPDVTVRYHWGRGTYRCWAEMRFLHEGGSALQIMTRDPMLLQMKASNVLGLDLASRVEYRDDADLRDMAETILKAGQRIGVGFEEFHQLLDIAPRESPDQVDTKGLERHARSARHARKGRF